MNRAKILSAIFLLISIGELVTVFNNHPAEKILKPLLLLSLGFLYMIRSSTRSNLFLGALLFSWVGDVALMFSHQSESYFLFGLVSFMIAHVLYIISFRMHVWSDAPSMLLATQRIRYSVPIILAGTGLLVVLYPVLGTMKLPVTAYALVLMLMTMNALFRFGRTVSASFLWVFAGSLLFMASDSMLAINKFFRPLPNAGFWVMLTYIMAQFSIVNGIIKHKAR